MWVVESQGETCSTQINSIQTLKYQRSNIGINRIDALLRTPNCPFVLYVGTKKLVI